MFKTKQYRIKKLKEYAGLALSALLFDALLILIFVF